MDAPEVEQFAREYADQITIIGLGTQNSLEEALDFVDTYGTTSLPMLWDPSFASWAELGITGQPSGMLVTPEGELVARWQGSIPIDRVLEAAAEL